MIAQGIGLGLVCFALGLAAGVLIEWGRRRVLRWRRDRIRVRRWRETEDAVLEHIRYREDEHGNVGIGTPAPIVGSPEPSPARWSNLHDQSCGEPDCLNPEHEPGLDGALRPAIEITEGEARLLAAVLTGEDALRSPYAPTSPDPDAPTPHAPTSPEVDFSGPPSSRPPRRRFRLSKKGLDEIRARMPQDEPEGRDDE